MLEISRHGAQAPDEVQKKWTAKYMTWLNTHVQFEQPALQATRLPFLKLEALPPDLRDLSLLARIAGTGTSPLGTCSRNPGPESALELLPSVGLLKAGEAGKELRVIIKHRVRTASRPSSALVLNEPVSPVWLRVA